MWKNQWTRQRVPLTDEFREVIYDESQGIIDIAVKLYAMAQVKAIATGTETFTVKTIREVAADKLRLVRPMLDALRFGDMKRLAQYEDICPISIDDYITAYSTHLPSDFTASAKNQAPTLEEQAILKLLEMDIPPAAAKASVKKAVKQAPNGQPLSSLVKTAFKFALNIQEREDAPIQVIDGDLRQVTGDDPYDHFKKAGIIASKNEEF